MAEAYRWVADVSVKHGRTNEGSTIDYNGDGVGWTWNPSKAFEPSAEGSDGYIASHYSLDGWKEHCGARWVPGADWEEPAWVYPPRVTGIEAQGPTLRGEGSLFGVTIRIRGRSIVATTVPGQRMTVQIVNTAGAVVISAAAAHGGTLQLDLARLVPGVYAARAITGHGVAVVRLMVR